MWGLKIAALGLIPSQSHQRAIMRRLQCCVGDSLRLSEAEETPCDPRRRPNCCNINSAESSQDGQDVFRVGKLGIRLLKNRSSMELMPCRSLWINPQRRYYDESECKGEGNISKSYIVSAASHIVPLESLAVTECLDRHRLFLDSQNFPPLFNPPGQKSPYLFRSERTNVSCPNLPRSPAYNSHRDFPSTASGIFIRISLEG